MPYVDGSAEIRRIAEACGTREMLARACAERASASSGSPSQARGLTRGSAAPAPSAGAAEVSTPSQGEKSPPPFEGALVGFRPYLYPLPVAAFFLSLFAWIVGQPPVHVIGGAPIQ